MEERPRKRRRLVTGCEACRIGHLKCDRDKPSCRHCKKTGITCVREVHVRFRHFHSIAEDYEAEFPERHIWPSLTGPVEFHDETAKIARDYDRGVLLERLEPVPNREAHNVDPPGNALLIQHQSYTTPDSGNITDFGHFEQQGHCHTSPGVLSDSGEDLYSTCSQQIPALSNREAILMRNFIEKMASWADVTDSERHFEIEVPRRALHKPVLRYAILAFSSQHLNRGPRGDKTEALHYHNQCLELLIPALSASEREVDEDLIAAAAILRQFEEMDAEDYQCHLTGATRMLNTTSAFGFRGGLREATAWLCLRQDIYISLISQQPLRTNLRNFRRSNVFLKNDDFSWANKMVFLLSEVLSCAFNDSPSSSSCHILRTLHQEVEDWKVRKPATFTPIRFVPRGRNKEHRLPEIWMLSPVHVVGLQYYHIAKIVLAVSAQQNPQRGYDSLRRGRAIEKQVCNHLLVVLGLAKSNAKAENALYTARHSLSAWGGVLRHRLDQAAARELLTTVERITGWSTARSMRSLRDQWDEYSDGD